MTDESALSAGELRTAFGLFPTGVVAVCALDGSGERVGMAVSTFVPVSLAPPLLAISLQSGSRTWPLLRARPALGVSVLSVEHRAVARQLASYDGDRFVGLRTTVTDRGAVRLPDAACFYECTLDTELTAGDHVIALLQIDAVTADHERAPLVFHRSDFHAVAPLRPGGRP